MDSKWKSRKHISRQAEGTQTPELSTKHGNEGSATHAVHHGLGAFSRTLAHFSFKPSFRSWFGNPQEWGSAILVFITLAIATYSIDQAKWITPQPSLTLTIGLAILTSLILVRRRLPNKVTFSLAMVLGAIITVWQSSSLLLSPETAVKANRLIVALRSWWLAISTSQPNESTIHFATLLLFLTWIIGFISTWFILRKQNAWAVVSLGTITIAVNLSNLPKEYYYFFSIYLLAAMLLIGQTNLTKQRNWFKKRGGNYPRQATVYFMTSVICLSVLIISSVWIIPETQVNQLRPRISAEVPRLKDARAHWFNIFAAVPSKWQTLRSSEQEKLVFHNPLNLSDDIQFVITPEKPYRYWRTRRYDTYHSWGWTSNTDSDYMLNPGTPANEGKTLPDRQELTYTVENKLKTDVLLTAGEFISSNIPVVVKTLSEKGSTGNSSSADAALVAPTVMGSPIMNMSFGLDNIGQLLSRDKIMNSTVKNHNLSTKAYFESIAPASRPATGEGTYVAQSGAEDIISVIAPQLLNPYQRYTVAASINSATPAELSQAGNDYDRWVTEHYLQLPYTLPTQVRWLSQSLVKGLETPYEKVVAIKRFLRKFKYNTAAQAPPEDIDGVYYFLSIQREGNCNNFASAMVIMLRSAGVPSRLATGYFHQGEIYENTGEINIRVRDYHAWPEVYLPGHGWVEFEATPIAAVNEEDIFGEEGAGSDTSAWLDDEDDEMGGFGVAPSVTTSTNRLRWNLPYTIVSVSFLLMFALGLVLYRWLRRFERAEVASEVYVKMCRLASLVKSGPNAYETPLEYCTRLASVLPVQAKYIGNIAQVYTECQFSQHKTLKLEQKTTLRRSWLAVYRALLKRMLHLKRYLSG
ncbi:transglutaminase family protein [Chloroflexota bacterium]